MILGYIYEIFDKRTGECIYVGSTTTHPMLRWSTHIRDMFKVRRMFVHRYMFEQGPEHFDYRVLEECFCKYKVDLRKREQLYLDQRKPHCNRNAAYTTPEEAAAKNAAWHTKPVVCVCGAKFRRHYLPKHLRSAKHTRLMQEIALAKLKEDGAGILPRPVESPTGAELPGPAPPERITRVEAQAETKVHSARKIPRAHPNTAAADSTTG